jgi:hypothetical protein
VGWRNSVGRQAALRFRSLRVVDELGVGGVFAVRSFLVGVESVRLWASWGRVGVGDVRVGVPCSDEGLVLGALLEVFEGVLPAWVVVVSPFLVSRDYTVSSAALCG